MKNIFALKLKSSGLTEKDAATLDMRFVSDVGKLIAAHKSQAGIQIPYHNPLNGNKPTGFYRIRLLTPPNSFIAYAAKPLRYVQPANTGVAAYFPLNLEGGWENVIKDPDTPFFITEGEFKAACACKYDYPCVGLGGVYSWRSAKNGVAMLPELEQFALQGRRINIVFDSDVQTNPNVQKALLHLCNELTSRGAKPYVVKLPQIGGNKTGLDDLIVVEGVVPFNNAIKDAEQFAGSEALWEMNDDVVFVRNPSFVYDMKKKQVMSTGIFQREVFATRQYEQAVATASGQIKLVKKQTAVEWIKWPFRHEVESLTYAPGQPKFFNNKFNCWTPYQVEQKRGNIKPWKELIDYLFENSPDERRWFEQWCAWPLQHPERPKMLTAVILWGIQQGTGKTLVAYTLRQIYGEAFGEINSSDLHGDYNGWAVNRQLILGEEITGSDRRADADKIKSLITTDTIRVNQKFIAQFDMPNTCNFLFTSNHSDAFYLEDTDRRFFVHEVTADAPLPAGFYAEYDKWYKSKEGISALFYYLMHLDLQSFNPRDRAPWTASKKEMIEAGKSDHALWVATLKSSPAAVIKSAELAKCDLFTAAQLLTFYDPTNSKRLTVNGMARELKRSKIDKLLISGIPTQSGEYTSTNVYVIRNADKWKKATRSNLLDHWLSFFGRLQKTEQRILVQGEKR